MAGKTIPLILRIKREQHRKIAQAQDLIVEELYHVFNEAVLHGGTAIWRCYGGNRFSEDIDVYLAKDEEKINRFFSLLGKKGFTLEKRKIGKNSLYSQLVFERTDVRFEALFKRVDGVLKEYETGEGNLVIVYTLTPEQLIREKVDAYLKRLKARDLYDIFFLLRWVKDKSRIKEEINRLLKQFRKPVDEKDLPVLILEGIVPEAGKMAEYIRRSI